MRNRAKYVVFIRTGGTAEQPQWLDRDTMVIEATSPDNAILRWLKFHPQYNNPKYLQRGWGGKGWSYWGWTIRVGTLELWEGELQSADHDSLQDFMRNLNKNAAYLHHRTDTEYAAYGDDQLLMLFEAELSLAETQPDKSDPEVIGSLRDEILHRMACRSGLPEVNHFSPLRG
ncbi:hypothetical protein ACP26L_36540 (plasmid) [Paenibacillus sp. S-38]|uniref:hypothetical protein n=1 Tax=Paenibacillus sp. S-38 TaxID=3416710 RepID=UPI003CF1E411